MLRKEHGEQTTFHPRLFIMNELAVSEENEYLCEMWVAELFRGHKRFI